MKRPRLRISIGTLMALVVVIAADLGIVRYLLASKITIPLAIPTPTTVDLLVFALGVLPMASLLVLGAVARLPRLVRRGESAGSFVGFEVVGWASVFLFMTFSSLSPTSVAQYAVAVATFLKLGNMMARTGAPEWALIVAEVVYTVAAFTLPELALALLGGWLMDRSGLTVRIERRTAERFEAAPESDFREAA